MISPGGAAVPRLLRHRRQQLLHILRDLRRRIDLEITAARAPGFVAAELMVLGRGEIAVVTVRQRNREMLAEPLGRFQVETDFHENLAWNRRDREVADA